ncbi:type II toxin-antitoxin system RelE/ParE family toxin [Marinobacterium iners]|uniref:Proteic killer suppression protein n=1 Tax=Marinobacterium iners DSM 11526 TaxID=1122198 RepID=A0A1H4GAX7_9GAMM|nr:type II toxin-antitoxin system RelE/ParE family toxin [Marinobacterium iners]SEB06786.1 proteic killer suppression protein [Marinobacterium iners DSM 11526]
MAIKSFRHKGLEDFFYDGTSKGINPKHANKLETRLDRLDAATSPEDMNLPGYRLHPLKGKMQGRYAIDVSGAWRLTFEFDDGDAIVVDYEQYH